MIAINLYIFTKHENSTARPAGNGTAFQCKVKSPSSLETPRVELSTAYPGNFNYAYISAWNRYYFITDCRYEEGLWVLQLKVDVLATYKTEIGAASLYVLRSSAAFDGNIRDTYYPIKANNTKHHGYQFNRIVDGHETSIPGDYSSGVIVLNTSGIGTAGVSTLWQMLPAAFANLVSLLYTSIDVFQVSDFVQKIVQTFGGNPQSLINSAMWFPFPFDVEDVRAVTIGSWEAVNYSNIVGWKDINGNVQEEQDSTHNIPVYEVLVYGGIINDPVLLLPDVTFTLDKHPLAATRGNYLNLSPYTMYTLGLPGCGVVNLDTTKLQGVTGITIRRYMDAFTGQLFVKVLADGTDQVLAYMNGQIGIPIQLRGSNNSNSLVGGVGAAIAGIAGAVSTGGASAIAGAVAAGVGTALEIMGGTPTSSSMGAGFASITDERIWLDTIHYDITDADNTHNGRPLMQTRTISSIPGFIMVQKGDVPIAGTEEEQPQIRAYLEGGFYYE